MNYKAIKTYGDRSGNLNVLDSSNVPFDIERVFYITNTSANISRGNHSHYYTEEVIVAVSGTCDISITNLEGKVVVHHMTDPRDSVYLNKLEWIVMDNFSYDCVLLVLASTIYDPLDHISDKVEWEKMYDSSIS